MLKIAVKNGKRDACSTLISYWFTMMKMFMRFLYFLFLLLFATNVYSQNLMGTADNQVRVLSSDANSVVMEVVMDSFDENNLPFSVESVELGGQTFQRLVLKGLTHITEEGKPQLPIKGILLQIPEDAQLDLRVESKESVTYSGYRIPPTPVSEEGMRMARWQDGKMSKQPPAPFGKGDSSLPSCPFALLPFSPLSISIF